VFSRHRSNGPLRLRLRRHLSKSAHRRNPARSLLNSRNKVGGTTKENGRPLSRRPSQFRVRYRPFADDFDRVD
jgi:hypothetical protein